MSLRSTLMLGCAAAAYVASAASAQQVEREAPHCTPAAADAGALLARARRAALAEPVGDPVLYVRASEATAQDYQSDRSYPPFFLGVATRESWYQAGTGAALHRSRMAFPFGEFDFPVLLSASAATFQVRDTTVQPAAGAHAQALALRALEPWAQVHDWSRGGPVRVVGRCIVRDFPRVVLERSGPFGAERLALDPGSGLPVVLQREEPHYLWGQVSVEYVYSNWRLEGGFSYPGTSFRMVDGAAETSRTVAEARLIPRDSAPPLRLPDSMTPMQPSVPAFLRPSPPDPVEVSRTTRLLVNPGYTEGVVLLADTVFILDATQGEERARADSAAIARLFPGRYPIVLVVTDLAWPHIAGLRYWVARGATVVSHRMSRPFLERVLARRWTRAPDLYERRRGTARLHFRPVHDSLSLAGGRLRVYPIDGIGSEGGLMAWVPEDGFLWAGDYIQTVQEPTTYATDVWRAARRAGIRPARTAAQHLPLTAWSIIDSLARAGGARPS